MADFLIEYRLQTRPNILAAQQLEAKTLIKPSIPGNFTKRCQRDGSETPLIRTIYSGCHEPSSETPTLLVGKHVEFIDVKFCICKTGSQKTNQLSANNRNPKRSAGNTGQVLFD
jgi:hypothetical protein